VYAVEGIGVPTVARIVGSPVIVSVSADDGDEYMSDAISTKLSSSETFLPIFMPPLRKA
jgi:hypothetical protein